MQNHISNYEKQVDIGKKIFLGYNQEILIRKFQLQADDMWIYITYMSTPYRICRKTGTIEERLVDGWKPCRSYDTVMTIYDLLCFHQGEEPPALSGQWCTVGTFVASGIHWSDTFTRKYASVFNGRIVELKASCEALGGVHQPCIAQADVTCKIYVTSFFPVLLQFWDGDDEFAPKIMVMWDKNTDRFLHFETTFLLQADLLQRLNR